MQRIPYTLTRPEGEIWHGEGETRDTEEGRKGRGRRGRQRRGRDGDGEGERRGWRGGGTLKGRERGGGTARSEGKCETQEAHSERQEGAGGKNC